MQSDALKNTAVELVHQRLFSKRRLLLLEATRAITQIMQSPEYRDYILLLRSFSGMGEITRSDIV
jgi:hypothetical protein